VLQLQSAAGNAAMTALLAPRVQRQAVAVASAEAPGLVQTVADEVNDLIAKKQRQKALDVLVAGNHARRGDPHQPVTSDGAVSRSARALRARCR